MANFTVPTNATLHAAKSFIEVSNYFDIANNKAALNFHDRWMHTEPFALSMLAAWSSWCRENSLNIQIQNLTRSADYIWRMGLFNYLPIDYSPSRTEHEEAGRFMPIKNIKNSNDIRAAIADISALLHMDDKPESLAAVQYCVSELLRNSIEHSNSTQGAFICAQNYTNTEIPRVSIAVADCGIGITSHLERKFPQVQNNDKLAIEYALRPGVTGAIPGVYGTPDNAGAGLFITRSIAKGCGGYFFLYSGDTSYRLKRASVKLQTDLFPDALLEPHNFWQFANSWQGTVVALEILTDRIVDFDSYLSWIRDKLMVQFPTQRRIKFT